MSPVTANTAAGRRPQQRALETRAALLDAAIEAFSTRGFDGVSVRQLEELAVVKRGLVAYHFSDKQGLWKAAVDRLFAQMGEAFGGRLTALADVPAREAARALLRAFVRFSAARPELNRLMIQECARASWRVDYIVGQHVRPMLEWLAGVLPDAHGLVFGRGDPHRYYMLVGAATFVFSAEAECAGLFGVSPRTNAFVEHHAEQVLDLLVPRSSERGNP